MRVEEVPPELVERRPRLGRVALAVSDLVVGIPNRPTLLTVPHLELGAGEIATVMGPSGVGKTTLLNCLAGIISPTSGTIQISGSTLTELNAEDRARFRLAHIGVLFQFGELLPELTVVENVALPARLLGTTRDAAIDGASHWLAQLGVEALAEASPDSLSGGETQRVALARAVASSPDVILADEPTGMLDERTSRDVVKTVVTTCRDAGIAAVLVTHDSAVARAGDVRLSVHRGVVGPV